MSAAPQTRAAYLGLPGVTADPVGLVITGEISYADFEQVGAQLGHLRDWSSWAVGDWIIAGEALFGDDAAQAVEVLNRSKDTLLEYVRVCRKFPRTRRRADLSFTHHQAVASREPDVQDDLLDRALANKWTIEEFRGVLRDESALTRQRHSRGEIEVLELVQDVARLVLERAQPLGDGYARVPQDVLDRLANALGVKVA